MLSCVSDDCRTLYEPFTKLLVPPPPCSEVVPRKELPSPNTVLADAPPLSVFELPVILLPVLPANR